MQFRQKLAKAIRVISAPPFAAAAFALILYFNPAGAIVRRDQLVACLLGLSVGPVLAYPISAALHTGREKQRHCDVHFAAVLRDPSRVEPYLP